jgi:DNA-binding FadR family transcriptional regulator
MTTPERNPVDTVPPERKLASQVADRIIGNITRDGWKVGTIIGSEAELLERYDVSRAVFREAVRLLEHLGVATTRRGPGGGLVVTEPSSTAVVQAFMVYLTFTDVTIGELLDARTSIERSVARLAAERADDHQIGALRDRVAIDNERDSLNAAAHHVLHTMIAAAAANPAAELFVDVLGRMTARWSYPKTTARERNSALDASAHAHRAIVDAITAGDTALAERRMSRHLGALATWLGSHRTSPSSIDWLLDSDPAGEKLGSQVARSVMVDIVDRGWPLGEVLGSETELIDKYDVSRSALREAVRILEYHEVATMKRGPGGGLVVTAPSVGPIVRAATVFLVQRGITPGDLIAIRRELESDSVALAAEHASEADIAMLQLTVEANAKAGYEGPISNNLPVRIAQVTGNPAIAVFVRVLVQLTRLHTAAPGRRSARRAQLNSETERAHRAIVEAIERRDPALARRRVTKYLSALEPMLR